MAADLNVTERVIRLDGERGERGPAVWLPWWPLVVCSARQLLPKAHHRSHFCTQPKNNQAQSVVVRPRTLPHHDGVIVMYTREERERMRETWSWFFSWCWMKNWRGSGLVFGVVFIDTIDSRYMYIYKIGGNDLFGSMMEDPGILDILVKEDFIKLHIWVSLFLDGN